MFNLYIDSLTYPSLRDYCPLYYNIDICYLLIIKRLCILIKMSLEIMLKLNGKLKICCHVSIDH